MSEENKDDLLQEISFEKYGVYIGWLLIAVAFADSYLYDFLQGTIDRLLYFIGIFFVVFGYFGEIIARLKLVQFQTTEIISKLDKENNK